MPALLKKYHDRENGFTLIELLIVVLIIGVLAAIAIPVYLGIQQQTYKANVRSDVNISVKRVQVGLTEGASVSDVKANPSAYTQKSVKGENVYIAASTTTGAGANDFALSGVVNTTTTPAGPINYSYTYDSVTGNFTESSSGLAFGSANPTITITTAALANAVVGNAYTQTVSAATTSPTAATTWSATGLPSGWSINPTTGVISAAAANVTTTGTYPVTVTAVNGSVTDNHTYNLQVTNVPTITTSTLSTGLVGTSYSATLTANGTPAPTFAVTTGSLPAGLNLASSTGVISGTPTTAGSYPFTVTATNTAGSNAASYTIVVNSTPTVTTTALPDATTGNAYNYTVTASGSPAPTFSATGLPSGLNIDAGTGLISGTPANSAGATTASVKITVTNSTGSTNTTLPMNVNAVAPTITTTSLDDAVIGQAYNYQLNATGGTGAITWSVANIPGGMGWNSTTGVLNGTPTGTPNVWNVTITATASGKSSSVTLTLHVTQQLTITNANAEDTSNGGGTWGTYWYPNTAFDASTYHSANHSFQVTRSSDTRVIGIIACTAQNLPANSRITFKVWVKGTAGANWNVAGRTPSYEGWGNYNYTTDGAWHQITLTYVIGGAESNSCIQMHENAPVSGDVLWMDDLSAYVG